jgi:hypothetical protein
VLFDRLWRLGATERRKEKGKDASANLNYSLALADSQCSDSRYNLRALNSPV